MNFIDIHAAADGTAFSIEADHRSSTAVNMY